MTDQQHWLPLESNPDVMNKFVINLGLTGEYSFTDVFGLDPELLQMVPRPVAALLLLFPVGEAYSKNRVEEAERIAKDGQVLSPNTFFMKQTIGNACGTIGLLHAIGNNLDKVQLAPDSYLAKFFNGQEGMTPEEIGHHLETSEGISVAHEESAQEGQTAPPAPDEDVNLHFVCLAEKDGHLYEFDGVKEHPINHGATNQDTFLEDAVEVVKKFMARDPEELRFTVVAFAKVSEEAD